MDILLKILMIIGIIVLVILGIILLLVIVILAAPIKYSASVKASNGDICVLAKIKWLLFIGADVSYKDKKPEFAVKLFGKRIFPKAEKESVEKDVKKETKRAAEAVKSDAKESVEAVAGAVENTADEAVKLAEDTAGKAVEAAENTAGKAVGLAESVTETDASTEKTEENLNAGADEKEKETVQQKIDRLSARIKKALDICGKEKDEVEIFFKRKSTKYAFDVLKKDIIKLICHIRPRKLNGSITFGFDDPSKTGYALAAISAFYGLYCESLDITPDFSEKTLEADVSLSGRIFLGRIAYIAIDVIIRKQVRRFIKNVLSLKDTTLENIDCLKQI